MAGMGRIDVTRVLRSTRFKENFTVERNAESVDPTTGRVVLTPVTMPPTIPGVVNPTTPKQDFTGEKRTARRAIRIHTQTRLYDTVTGFQPDIVTWLGDQFKVVEANPWSQYGEGFYDVYCEILETGSAA